MGAFKTECQTIRPIDFSVLDFDRVEDEASNSDPFIEVSTAEPYRIRNVSQQWLDNFLFSREEISGRTLRVICGPATRVFDLKQAIATAAYGKQASSPVCLYSSVGACKMMSVTAQPSASGETCKLTMVPSDAVTYKEAIQMDDCSRAIISAHKPFMIEQVNGPFSYEFGMTQELWMQKSLRMIQGPRTNSASFSQMVKGASDGLSRTEELVMYTSDCQEIWCEVSVVPVLATDGTIGHFMVAFSPVLNNDKQNLLTGIEADLDSLRFPVPSVDSNNFTATSSAASSSACFEPANFNTAMHHPQMSFEQTASSCSSIDAFHFPLQAASAIDSTMFSAEVPQVSHSTALMLEHYDPSTNSLVAVDASQKTSLKLIPRKKRPASGEFVELTTAKLQELSGKSMKAAAEELGIAASTLKKACRKLGVERWPSGTQARNSKGLSDYDGSYVRRLFNKYNSSPALPSPAASPPSPPSPPTDSDYWQPAAAEAQAAPVQVQESWACQWVPEEATLTQLSEFDVAGSAVDYGLEAMQW